ncbi:hypothetical protein CL65_gp015 [Mycobacterium phage Patience]|uniref:Uncharacterized protein n=1 Tax=Mycobacterium phage Patience TaxID=1074308 RepID=G1JWC5_9CAUD|nr:hypothetical protein CL65_gp015 [Mycobacterium phage Patience]AEL97923.1 hypothetical protein PATIENCE_14 [Mycobacterium phage Patience]
MARRRRYGSFTPARRAALKKAQLASARKRRRGISKKKAVIGATLALAGGAAAVYGSRKLQTVNRKQNAMKKLSGTRVTLTITKPISGRYSSSGISRSGLGVMRVHHGSLTQGLRISTIGGMGISASTLTGKKTPSRVRKIDRDAIPFYDKNNSQSWPSKHGGTIANVRRVNRLKRKKGLLE